jgi:hypothetical protein
MNIKRTFNNVISLYFYYQIMKKKKKEKKKERKRERKKERKNKKRFRK